MNYIDNELRQIDEMTGNDFEDYMTNLLSKVGYKHMVHTPMVNDHGLDAYGYTKNGTKIGFQFKRYNNKVPYMAVYETIGGARYYHTHINVLLTNNFYADNTIQTCNTMNASDPKNPILLWNRYKLKSLISKVYNQKQKEINHNLRIQHQHRKQYNNSSSIANNPVKSSNSSMAHQHPTHKLSKIDAYFASVKDNNSTPFLQSKEATINKTIPLYEIPNNHETSKFVGNNKNEPVINYNKGTKKQFVKNVLILFKHHGFHIRKYKNNTLDFTGKNKSQNKIGLKFILNNGKSTKNISFSKIIRPIIRIYLNINHSYKVFIITNNTFSFNKYMTIHEKYPNIVLRDYNLDQLKEINS